MLFECDKHRNVNNGNTYLSPTTSTLDKYALRSLSPSLSQLRSIPTGNCPLEMSTSVRRSNDSLVPRSVDITQDKRYLVRPKIHHIHRDYGQHKQMNRSVMLSTHVFSHGHVFVVPLPQSFQCKQMFTQTYQSDEVAEDG